MPVAIQVQDLSRHAAAMAGYDTIVAVEPDFDFRAPPFLRLFQKSAATAFQHPLWLEAFYRAVAHDQRMRKIVVTVRDTATGAMRLALPLVLRDSNGLRLIETADLGVGDMAAPIFDCDWVVPDDMVDRIAAVLPEHDLLRIRPVRADMVQSWNAFIEADSHPTDFFGASASLTGPFPEWRSGALGQAFRKMPRPGATPTLKCGASALRPRTDSAEIANAIESIRRNRAGRFEADPIQEKPVLDFYTSLAVSGVSAGFANVYAVMAGDRAVGHVLGITWRGRYHYLLVGCHFDSREGHLPALMVYDAMIADWSKVDSAVFHFTIGDAAMLQQAPASESPMQVLSRARTWRGRLARAAIDATEHVERMKRTTLVA